MKFMITTTLGLLCMASALAQSAAQPKLDLNVPRSASGAYSTAGSKTANDPPGTYYGDVGGNGAADTNTTVSGGVSTMVGYSKGYGTGIATAADLNLHTRTTSGRDINVNISVTQSNGLPGGWGYGYGPGFRP